MDITPIEHGAISVALMCLIGLTTGYWVAGAALAIGIFIGREQAQAEYRWMDLMDTNRTGKETLGAFDPKVLNLASMLDWIVPVITCCALLYFVG